MNITLKEAAQFFCIVALALLSSGITVGSGLALGSIVAPTNFALA